MNTYVHTHTHTHVPHIDFHCNIGGVAPTCTYTACGVSWATNTSRVHSKSVGGGGIYNNRRSNTSKGWGFPKKGAPPPPPPHPTHHTGSAGHLDWTVELLWPHPPDVQACTSMYAVNSCSPYTVYGIGQGRDLPLPPPIHPLVCP